MITHEMVEKAARTICCKDGCVSPRECFSQPKRGRARAALLAVAPLIREAALEEAAKVAENMPVQMYRDEGIGPAGRSCKATTIDDAAAAIRDLKSGAA